MKNDKKQLSFGKKIVLIFLLAEKNKEIKRLLISAGLTIASFCLVAIFKKPPFFTSLSVPLLLVAVAFLVYISYKLRWEFYLESSSGFPGLRQEIAEDITNLETIGLLIPQNDLSLLIMTSDNPGLKTPYAQIKDRNGEIYKLKVSAVRGGDKKYYLKLDLSETIELLGAKVEIKIGMKDYQWTNPWHLDLNKAKLLAFKLHDFKILLSEKEERFPEGLGLLKKRGLQLVFKESNLLPYLDYYFDFYTGGALYKKNLRGQYSYKDETLNFELPDNLEKEDLIGENIRLIYTFDPRFKIESEIIKAEELNETKHGLLRLYRLAEA